MEKVDSPKQFVQNKTSYTSTKKEQQPQITSSLPKSNEHEAQKPEITVVASKFSPKQPEVNHERDSVSSGIWNLTCNTHKSTSEVNSKCSERAKTAEKKTTSPDAKDAHAVDSEDENKAVFDFLKELRSDKKFSCFEDLSKNPPEVCQKILLCEFFLFLLLFRKKPSASIAKKIVSCLSFCSRVNRAFDTFSSTSLGIGKKNQSILSRLPPT